MKDLFSQNSAQYALYRPNYPNALIHFLLTQLNQHQLAWDCATGNGQLAIRLAAHFERIIATDMSESQLHHAIKKTNIDYIKTTAEEADFGDKKFNLICVAQAAHWLDLEKFYGVVVNHLAADGIITLIGYDLVQTSSACDHLIRKLYSDMLQGYWDDERKHIDTNYQNLYFPFDEIDCPDFCYQASWAFEHLIGYLNSWSAVGHYIKKNKQNPIDAIKNELADVWGNGTKRDIRFPVFVRAGKYHSQSI